MTEFTPNQIKLMELIAETAANKAVARARETHVAICKEIVAKQKVESDLEYAKGRNSVYVWFGRIIVGAFGTKLGWDMFTKWKGG